MTRTTTAGLAAGIGFAALIGLAAALLVEFDRDGIAGLAIGAGLGLLNLAVGAWATRRTLRRGTTHVMGTMLIGFFARLLVVAALILVFQKTEAVDALAFALAFMFFFFAYLTVEVLIVERTLNGSRRTA